MTSSASVFRIFLSNILSRAAVRILAVSSLIELNALSFRFCFALLLSTPVAAAWDVSGIDGNSKEEASVGEDEEEKKDSICHKDANRLSRTRRVDGGGRSEEIVDC